MSRPPASDFANATVCAHSSSLVTSWRRADSVQFGGERAGVGEVGEDHPRPGRRQRPRRRRANAARGAGDQRDASLELSHVRLSREPSPPTGGSSGRSEPYRPRARPERPLRTIVLDRAPLPIV